MGFFNSLFGNSKAEKSFNAFDEANSWISKNNINLDSIRFSSYDKPYLVRNTGATVIVGSGTYVNGENVGFALEVISNKGVVASEIIIPYGIASYHNRASMQAKMSNLPLLDVLVDMAAKHRVGLQK